MQASLPMYAFDRAAIATWWVGLARWLRDVGLPEVPDTLCWPENLAEHWLAPDLLLSQTCGYPLTHALAGRVQLVGTLHYHAPGCHAANYRSVLLVHGDAALHTLADLRGTVLAFNSVDSHSGYNALRALLASQVAQGRFFADVISTGSHLAAIDAVRNRQADVAAIDCVTLALLEQHDPARCNGLRKLAYTDSAPGLPLITCLGTSMPTLQAIQRAIDAAIADPTLATARHAQHIVGFSRLTLADYAIIPRMRTKAATRGIDQL